MSLDLRDQVDAFLLGEKTIIGPPAWSISPRPNTLMMKRSLLLEGEVVDAFFHCIAHPRTPTREFHHLIVYGGKTVTRLDFAPSVDGPHLNSLACPIDYPKGEVDDLHYHDWGANRQFANGKVLSGTLPCAKTLEDRITDIDQAFWWFCDQNNIRAETFDVPGWPTSNQLL